MTIGGARRRFFNVRLSIQFRCLGRLVSADDEGMGIEGPFDVHFVRTASNWVVEREDDGAVRGRGSQTVEVISSSFLFAHVVSLWRC